MTPRRFILVTSFSLFAMNLSNSVTAAPIQYDVIDLLAGVPSISGTITADGTLGVLTTANIIGWNLLLSTGTQTESLVSGTNGSFEFIVGTALSASLTTLTFNFSAAGNNEFSLADSAPFNGQLCYTSYSNCFGPAAVGLWSVGSTNQYSGVTPLSGFQIIANNGTAVSAVPEPASLLLLGTGLVAGVRRWRKRNSRATNG